MNCFRFTNKAFEQSIPYEYSGMDQVKFVEDSLQKI